MPRVKRGTVRRAKRKKLLKLAKGYFANKSKLYRAAKESTLSRRDTVCSYWRSSPSRASAVSYAWLCGPFLVLHAAFSQLLGNSEFKIQNSLIRQHACDLRHVYRRHGRRSLEPALALPGLAGQDVLAECAAPEELAVLGPLEALRGAAVGLQFDLLRFFRHRVPCCFTAETAEIAEKT